MKTLVREPVSGPRSECEPPDLHSLDRHRKGVTAPQNYLQLTLLVVSRDSAVRTAIAYRLDDRGVGVRVPIVSTSFSSPGRPDRLWGPTNLLSNEYRGFFPGSKAGRA
jgi:hypothetical protein